MHTHARQHMRTHTQVYKAMPYNKALVRSLARVGELGSWPWEAGGGPVLDPRALVVLGDMTEFYREDEVDAFRSLYDPSVAPPEDAPPPAASGSSNATTSSSGGPAPQSPAQVSLPTWFLFGNHDIAINVNDCAGQFKR